MNDDVQQRLDKAQDTTHAIVTCLLNGNRDEAATIITSLNDLEHLGIALVACDLAAFIHHQWSDNLGLNTEQRLETWRQLLLDVAEWRGR